MSGDPVRYSESALENLDPFRRGIVSRDLNKTFWNEIENAKPDFLLIDFAEEQFGLVSPHEGKSLITNSNYFNEVKTSVIGQESHLIKIESDEFKELWVQACQDFSRRTTSLKIKSVLARMYVPEGFASKGAICSFDGAILSKIKRINSHLDWCYGEFLQNVYCHEIIIPRESQISHLSEGKKIGIADYAKELSGCIAARIAVACELEPYLVSPAIREVENVTSAEKVDMYLSAAASLLDAGDIPGIYELYMRGKSLKLSGDEKGALRCQRLISLLRNSSVPLSAELGKVSSGYGGIGIIIHANAKIGDYVTIGSNVTVGGARTKRNRHGESKCVPVIRDRVYIATGAKILGGIEIGSHCVIGANAVVTRDIPDLSVVAGVPGKVVAKITPDNLPKYSGYLYRGTPLPEVRRMMFNC